MKLLYLDADARYINPTAALLPSLMRLACPGMQMYGPGYSSREALAQGVRRWVDANGPFDALLVGPWVPFFSTSEHADVEGARFIGHYTVHPHLEATELVQYFRDVLGSLSALPVPVKMVTSLALDTYAATRAQVDRMLEAGLVLLGPNHQFGRPLADWPPDALQRDYQRKKTRLSDAWFDFLSACPERVLTASHYVADDEVCLTALDSRRWDIAVPGTEYALRRDAVRLLRSAGVRVAPKRYFHLFRAANALGVPVYRYDVTSRLYNLLFRRTLCDSRMAFTAPSAAGNLIRKFVEIPASGALLACTPCSGFDALGFEDGRHFVKAAPGDLPRLATTPRGDEALQQIASAGRDLVMSRHSMSARARQIAQGLEALRKGTYRGASWQRGAFVVHEAAHAAYAHQT